MYYINLIHEMSHNIFRELVDSNHYVRTVAVPQEMMGVAQNMSQASIQQQKKIENNLSVHRLLSVFCPHRPPQSPAL